VRRQEEKSRVRRQEENSSERRQEETSRVRRQEEKSGVRRQEEKSRVRRQEEKSRMRRQEEKSRVRRQEEKSWVRRQDGKRRVRRTSRVVEELVPTIIYPGTFWCGRGSLADATGGSVGILAELDGCVPKTVHCKKNWLAVFRFQPRCHLPKSPRPEIYKLFPA
jgi:hypothetical protein